jgi:hypothetical protein
MAVDSPSESCRNRQRLSELEPPYLPVPCQQASRIIQETQTCVGTGSCKRLHLSHPHLCKKIVEKARRALSKLGRKPSRKTLGNSNISPSFHNAYLGLKSSAQDATACSMDSPDATTFELPAYGVFEAPGSPVLRNEAQQSFFEDYRDTVSPLTPFHRYSDSGSSVSTWIQKTSPTPSSTRYTSYTDIPGLTSPVKRLSELEGSPSSFSSLSSLTPFVEASHILPVIGEDVSAKTVPIRAGSSHRPRLHLDMKLPTGPGFRQEGSLEDLYMGDWNFCSSPTSLLLQHDFSDNQIVDASVHEVGQANRKTYVSCPHVSTGSEILSEDVAGPKQACADALNRRFSRSNDLDVHAHQITMLLCLCHGLPMQPDMHLSDLVAGARNCGVSLHLLVKGDQSELAHRIESMFSLLVEHALQRLNGFEPEVRAALAPIFQALPTIRSGLEALNDLNTRQLLPSVHGLVSIVFMAFSTLILTVDEHYLSTCTGALYHDITSWPEVLVLTSEKQAFISMLDLFWLPEAGYHAGAFQHSQYCPYTFVDQLSKQDLPLAILTDHLCLRNGMATRICRDYVDCEQTDSLLISQLTYP